MVCKKIFKWFVILFVIVFLFSSFTSSAAYTGYVEYFQYDGTAYPYCLTSEINFSDASGNEYKVIFDRSVYCFAYRYKTAQSIQFYSHEPFTYSNSYTGLQQTIDVMYDNSYHSNFSCSISEIDIPYFDISDSDVIRAWQSYFAGDTFVQIVPPTPVSPDGAIPNKEFALFNPKASVVDGVLTATWSNGLLNYWPHDFYDMPLLIDLSITDNDTGQKLYTSYPAKSALPDADRLTYYDVQDYQLSFNLNKVENLPSNFTLNYIMLTPYYRVKVSGRDELVVYKGQSSMLILNYDGTLNGVVQIIPDTPVPEPEPEDPSWGIFGLLSNFFGGFFTDFGNMLKNLFIPTEGQLTDLFDDMQTFFGDKLGFLWFPFDFVIEIADALGQGSADSVFVVPSIDVNILGGIHLYDGGSFDMDETGIFVYVRFFTSVVLACGLYGFSINKWNEFIKGEDG